MHVVCMFVRMCVFVDACMYACVYTEKYPFCLPKLQHIKRMSSDFSPLSELKTLAQVLLQSLDNTKVYILTNINRDPSLKPNIKGIRGIKSHHCF